MKLILDPEVHSDVLEIMEYYDRVADPEISADFYFEFRRCIDKIAARPYSFPFYIDDYRRLNLDRFPHHVLYRIINDDFVRILVVRHDSRHPSFGLDR